MIQKKPTLRTLTYLYKNSYGSAIRIKKKVLISLFIIFCVCTPCTNFLILFSKKLIKKDLVIRYK